eukprot:TRINITY_DN19826_c0_g1_i1.p1 TRINITY_DN19826_c0_g1~~TRINITY_DN19826_c0_g1_i1.p1  ORF type:complete len:736 (-),score=156.21 TRINITY_DN19826_c0_g1_i1:9-2216(-)
MEQSDEDISDEDSSDNDMLVPLPCDRPMWPDIYILLQQLQLCRTSCDIGRVIAEIDDIANTNCFDTDVKNINTIEYFLDEVCGEEERNVICSILVPAIASIALNVYKSKPYVGVVKFGAGESEIRTVHPNFLASILANSFLSTTGRTSLNLNVLKLDPHASITHWKLRCFFHHFHQTLQGKKYRSSSISKESLKKDELDETRDFSEETLVSFITTKEPQEIGEGILRVCFCDDFSQGILPNSTPLNSDCGIKNLECLIPFLYVNNISPTESLRISLPENGQLSITKTPDIHRTEEAIKDALQSFLVSMKPCTSNKEKTKSILRRPSVAAVTSADSDSENEETKSSSKRSLSMSDSCINNQTDSELSYNLSDKEREACIKGKPARKTKLRRKDTFNERLKAALERGNTPDESDDQSANPSMKKPVQFRRCLRRQRSTGFRAFNDNVEESEDFFTATEDELSYTPAKSEKVTFKVVKNSAVNPLMRRKLLQDKSFDLSTSSAQVTSPSLPVSSLQTGSSNLFSDSSSFSSEGLGMPKMDEDCMEDLCDNLKGCIETSEGGLEFRNVELRRAVKGLGIRSLSDTFISSIGDMDRLSYMTATQRVISAEESIEENPPKRSLSSPNLYTASDWSVYNDTSSNNLEYKSVFTQSIISAGWKQQVWPLLLWVSASTLKSIKEVTFNTAGHEGLEDLADTVDKLVKKNIKCVELINIILEFIRGKEEDLFIFIDKSLENKINN